MEVAKELVNESVDSCRGGSFTLRTLRHELPQGVIVFVCGFPQRDQYGQEIAAILGEESRYDLYFWQAGDYRSLTSGLDDLELIVARAKDRAPMKPLYLVADGIGATFALMCAMGQAESIGGVVAVEPLLFDPPRTWRQQALCSLAGLMPGAPLNLARRLTPPAPQLERFKDFLASLSNTEVVALVKKLWEIREGAASFFTPLKVYVAAKELERVSQFFADTPSSDAQVYMNDADQDLIGIFKKERAWLLKQLPLTAHSQEENDDDD